MTKMTAPSFRELSQEECAEVLDRNHVGRVAFTFRDRVDVEPINYVYAHPWLHGRTALGTKLFTLQRHPWVAFEVDEVEGLFDWRSVVVHGVVDLLNPAATPADDEAYADTLTQLRRLLPETLTVSDPFPGRAVLFRIHIDSLTGRAASSGSGGSGTAARRTTRSAAKRRR